MARDRLDDLLDRLSFGRPTVVRPSRHARRLVGLGLLLLVIGLIILLVRMAMWLVFWAAPWLIVAGLVVLLAGWIKNVIDHTR